MGTFTMPSLGSDMVSGQLSEWLVSPGDRVTRGDTVAVVETQKGAIEIEIFEDGVVEKLIAKPGQTLLVGAPMAEISGTDARPAAPEATPSPAPASLAASSTDAVTQTPATGAEKPVPYAPIAGHPPSSPAAKSLAAELGVDLATVAGSGPGGAVLRADVEKAAAPGKPSVPKPGFDPSAMRAAIGATMERSKRDIPHYYLAHDIDLQTASDWLRDINAAKDPSGRILMSALFVKATALAADHSEVINGHYADGAFHPAPEVHVGLAVALRGGGLVAPALKDTAQLPLELLMERMRDLVERARAGRLRSSELTEPTLTVSILGDGGVDAMTGIIFPPQVAIVAFGAARTCARPVDGRVQIRETVTVTLSADHRVSDGRTGARYLKEIDTLLQRPEAL